MGKNRCSDKPEEPRSPANTQAGRTGVSRSVCHRRLFGSTGSPGAPRPRRAGRAPARARVLLDLAGGGGLGGGRGPPRLTWAILQALVFSPPGRGPRGLLIGGQLSQPPALTVKTWRYCRAWRPRLVVFVATSARSRRHPAGAFSKGQERKEGRRTAAAQPSAALPRGLPCPPPRGRPRSRSRSRSLPLPLPLPLAPLRCRRCPARAGDATYRQGAPGGGGSAGYETPCAGAGSPAWAPCSKRAGQGRTPPGTERDPETLRKSSGTGGPGKPSFVERLELPRPPSLHSPPRGSAAPQSSSRQRGCPPLGARTHPRKGHPGPRASGAVFRDSLLLENDVIEHASKPMVAQKRAVKCRYAGRVYHFIAWAY